MEVRFGVNVLRSHSSPRVDKTVSSIPTGRRPHVGPNMSWSTSIMCSPCLASIHYILARRQTNRVKDPSHILLGHSIDILATLSKLMQEGKRVDSLIKATRQSTK
jgi:hypothetical protein